MNYLATRLKQKTTWLAVAGAVATVALRGSLQLEDIGVVAMALGLIHVNDSSHVGKEEN